MTTCLLSLVGITDLVSLVYNFVFLFTLLGCVLARGVDPSRLPFIGQDQSHIIGQVLYNFSINI